MNEELKPLSKKHQRLLDEYLICWVQWRAYKKVYPKSSDEVARTLASRLFADVNFSAHLQARLDEAHMSANEALQLQANIARGDIGELLDNNGLLDIRLAKSSGMTRLLKKIKQKTITHIGKNEDDGDTEIHEIEFEMYPADVAQERILKMHGKIKPDNGQFEIVVRYANPDDKSENPTS